MKTFAVLEARAEWDVIDATKLTAYMRCPRHYFYRYILGWQSRRPNIHFIFGSAWHAAVAYIIEHKYAPTALADAALIFEKQYRAHFSEMDDENVGPKTLANGLRALAYYFAQTYPDAARYDALHIETGGIVNIADDAPMAFRIDLIRRDRDTNMIEFVEQKTSSIRHGDWIDRWYLDLQISLYLHVLYCLLDASRVDGARVRGAFIYKNRDELHDVLVTKSPQQMQGALDNMLVWYDALRREMELLADVSTDDMTMNVFPRNPNGCYHYMRLCEFHSVCCARENPIAHVPSTPADMHIVHWDPLADDRLREIVDLTAAESEGGDVAEC